MARTDLRLHGTDEMQATLSYTMKLGDWKILQGQLQDKWPSYEFISEIRKLVAAAEKHFNEYDFEEDTQ